MSKQTLIWYKENWRMWTLPYKMQKKNHYIVNRTCYEITERCKCQTKTKGKSNFSPKQGTIIVFKLQTED